MSEDDIKQLAAKHARAVHVFYRDEESFRKSVEAAIAAALREQLNNINSTVAPVSTKEKVENAAWEILKELRVILGVPNCANILNDSNWTNYKKVPNWQK